MAKKGAKGGSKGASLQQKDQRAAKQASAARTFEDQTKQFMFTMLHLTKALPDGSRTLLKNINLCFYPGAKIGVVGLNGSGKSTLLKIMAGVDKEFDGQARPKDGISIGYLPQEPELTGETVDECMKNAMADGQRVLDRFTELSARLSEPLDEDEMQAVVDETARVQDQIEASNLWELERVVERATVALRCPPADAKTAVLSGGEKRRVALAALLIQGHDMLLLDEPTNHLDAASVGWLEQFLDTFTVRAARRRAPPRAHSPPPAAARRGRRAPSSRSLTTATSSRTRASGSSSSTAARACRLKALTRAGCRLRR